MWDGLAILIGIVIGMGIFKAPSLVAEQSGREAIALGFWALGGVVSLLGALTYAELAAAYPDKGGEYHFLRRAYGRTVAYLFGWARLSVIQTGTIAGAGFVLGDYVTRFLPLGPYGPAIVAAIAVVGLTLVQLRGLELSARMQAVLSSALAACLLGLIAAAALSAGAPAPDPAGWTRPALPQGAAVGLAMVFVLLTYGGWNEAAYLSGEFKRPQREATTVLVVGVLIVSVLYVGANWAYFHLLGFEGVRQSATVGAAAAEAAFGPVGAALITVFVIGATLSTMHGTLFTGARSGFALGRDFKSLSWLARWDAVRAAPTAGILIQSGVTLALVALGAWTKAGFETMVAYTAPVFWAFFMLTGLAAIVLRFTDPGAERPFLTPLFPVTPLLFSAAAGWMLASSVSYALSLGMAGEARAPFATGVGFGLAMLALGLIGLVAERLCLGADKAG